jgi:hypothetical protein
MPAFKNTTKVTQKVREKIKYQGDVAQWILVASKIDKNKQKTFIRGNWAFVLG